MAEARSIHRILVGKPFDKRMLRELKSLGNHIKWLLGRYIFGDSGWIDLAQERNRWEAGICHLAMCWLFSQPTNGTVGTQVEPHLVTSQCHLDGSTYSEWPNCGAQCPNLRLPSAIPSHKIWLTDKLHEPLSAHRSMPVQVYNKRKRFSICYRKSIIEGCRLLGCDAVGSCENWNFGGTYGLHLQADKNRRAKNNVSTS
jgi:hypothetical protein